MHKSATKCNETLDKWCKNKHGASKIMDTLETYHIHPHNHVQGSSPQVFHGCCSCHWDHAWIECWQPRRLIMRRSSDLTGASNPGDRQPPRIQWATPQTVSHHLSLPPTQWTRDITLKRQCIGIAVSSVLVSPIKTCWETMHYERTYLLLI
jgi:hypothetical protein